MYDWTIMVYLGGDNNLGQDMIWALKAIQSWRRAVEHAGHPQNLKVLALFDGGGPPVEFDFDKLQGGDAAAALLARTTEVRDEADDDLAKRMLAVEPVRTTLQKFISKSVKKHKAHHYMIVLSGHGSGAIGDFLTGDKRINGLSIPSLGNVLEVCRKELEMDAKFDILGFDTCQMSMAEIACQVQDSVSLMIGSEGFQPNMGWPYEEILTLLKTPEIANDAGLFAENVVKQHIQYYLDFAAADLSTDISVLNLKYFGELEKALAGFTQALQIKRENRKQWEDRLKMTPEDWKNAVQQSALADNNVRNAITLAHWEAQGYKKEQYADLWDFSDCLSHRLDLLIQEYGNIETRRDTVKRYQLIQAACESIKNVIEPQTRTKSDERFVRLSGYAGPQFQHSHGISVFFPWANLTDAAGIADVDHYQTLRFASATTWDEFLRLFVHITQRAKREEPTKGADIPSLLNQRTGLFIPKPGKDPDGAVLDRDPDGAVLDRTTLGTAKIESMKNPPIVWREWSGKPPSVEVRDKKSQ
jgi:hypothetical protein